MVIQIWKKISSISKKKSTALFFFLWWHWWLNTCKPYRMGCVIFSDDFLHLQLLQEKNLTRVIPCWLLGTLASVTEWGVCYFLMTFCICSSCKKKIWPARACDSLLTFGDTCKRYRMGCVLISDDFLHLQLLQEKNLTRTRVWFPVYFWGHLQALPNGVCAIWCWLVDFLYLQLLQEKISPSARVWFPVDLLHLQLLQEKIPPSARARIHVDIRGHLQAWANRVCAILWWRSKHEVNTKLTRS